MRPDDTLANDSYDAITTYGDSPQDIGPAGESDPRDDLDHAPDLAYARWVSRCEYAEENAGLSHCRLCRCELDDSGRCSACIGSCADCCEFFVRETPTQRIQADELCADCARARWRRNLRHYRLPGAVARGDV